MNLEFLSLFNLFCVVVLPYAIWRFGRLQSVMPCTVVQILIGILLGPSCLGSWAPDLQKAILPPDVINQVTAIANLAVLFFAFITGLHMDIDYYRGRVRSFAIVGVCSIALPFILGVLAALWIFQTHAAEVQSHGTEVHFLLSVAIALSVTALPVLGAILRELGLLEQSIGQWSLGLAAINDASLWFLVSALVVGFGAGQGSGLSPASAIVCGLLYLVIVYGVVRPGLDRLLRSRSYDGPQDSMLIAVTAFTVISAAAAQYLGLNYLLGAFIAGTALPPQVRKRVLERIEQVVVYLLTPFFFVATGLKVTVALSSPGFLAIFLATTAATILGKFFGTALPARAVGLSWRESFGLGSFMQAKGMMELAIITVLLQAGLISMMVFSALTLMSVVTTAIAMPLARIFIGAEGPKPANTVAAEAI